MEVEGGVVVMGEGGGRCGDVWRWRYGGDGWRWREVWWREVCCWREVWWWRDLWRDVWCDVMDEGKHTQLPN